MKEKRCVVPARPLDIPHTRPAQASLTLRPAGLLNRLKRPLSRGSSPAGYPAEPLVSYQINRQLSGGNLPPLVIRAFGAHCHEQTWSDRREVAKRTAAGRRLLKKRTNGTVRRNIVSNRAQS